MKFSETINSTQQHREQEEVEQVIDKHDHHLQAWCTLVCSLQPSIDEVVNLYQPKIYRGLGYNHGGRRNIFTF